ncbi:MAG: hypothetical protein JSU70_12460 [Phycisphaerales bacterium]|nr:MAG: hypothetical protein JSU70_12460 [Phycisphaerales bacterium]
MHTVTGGRPDGGGYADDRAGTAFQGESGVMPAGTKEGWSCGGGGKWSAGGRVNGKPNGRSCSDRRGGQFIPWWAGWKVRLCRQCERQRDGRYQELVNYGFSVSATALAANSKAPGKTAECVDYGSNRPDNEGTVLRMVLVLLKLKAKSLSHGRAAHAIAGVAH